jgi:transposase
MFFDELSNEEWALLSALVSDEPAVRLNRRGRPRAEPRVVANAVLWILSTGEPWSRLPGRYPSGPTCRRRFDEWQLNGTLTEMVRLLSQTGRRFAYVPEPSPPVVEQCGEPVAEPPVVREPRDEGPRGVFWKSPESWQSPQGVANDARPVDPFAEITRQLTGPDDEPVHTGTHERASVVSPAAGEAHHDEVEFARSPLLMGLSANGTELTDRRGYVIYVMAQSVPNEMHRAWAEIMKDGRRVERSGLVGPRFDTPEAAERFAFEWAQQWIDRHCRTLAAAAQADAMRAETLRAEALLKPVSRPMPAPRPPAPAPAVSAPAAVSAAVSAAMSGGPTAVPEPVAVHPANAHVAAHVTVNARRLPLRRYPGESTESTTDRADRYPTASELLSHPG